MNLLFTVLLNRGKKLFGKEKGKKGKQKNCPKVNQGKADALMLNLFMQFLQGIEDKGLGMLVLLADLGNAYIIIAAGRSGERKFKVLACFIVRSKKIFNGNDGVEVIQGFFLYVPAGFIELSLVKK